MSNEQIKILVNIAKICLEHKDSSQILARELGLSDEELDALYESLTNQHV